MAFFDTTWYLHYGDGSTVGHFAVSKWGPGQTVTPGMLRRQLAAPAANNERVFVCLLNGTTGGTEPVWVVTRGGRSPTDGNTSWMECTGQAGVNGDLANTPNWTNAALGSKAMSVGQVIANTAGTFYFICTAAGTNTSGEPSWVTTPGNPTVAGATYVCIGAVGIFSPFAAPHAQFAAAITANWFVAGNDIYVADNSFETSTGTLTLNAGTIAAPSRVMSVDRAVMPPTLKVGASFTSSNAVTNALVVCTAGSTYWYGVAFIITGSFAGGSMGIISNACYAKFEACSFQLASGSNSAASMTVGPGSQFEGMVDFINCTWGFSNVGQQVVWSGGWHTWRNTPDPCITGTIPTIPFRAIANTPAVVLFEGIDFTSVGSNTLFGTTNSGTFLTIKNCKLHTGLPVAAMTLPAAIVLQVDVINSDDIDVVRNERHNYLGDLYTSFNGGLGVYSIYRTGGATDGTTNVCHYILSINTTGFGDRSNAYRWSSGMIPSVHR